MAKKVLVLICIIGLFGMLGCNTLKKTHSGFLKSYKGFQEAEHFPGALSYNRRLGEMNNYNKYIINPVVIYYADPGKNKNVPDNVADDIASYFTNEIIKNLQDKYPIVNTPGPGVLRIRIAITDILASNPLMNISPYTKLTTAGAGGACVEGEAVDSVTGRRIGAFIDCRKGSEWNITGGLDDWQYAKDVCASWAVDFRKRMDIGYKDIPPETSPSSSNDTSDAVTGASASISETSSNVTNNAANETSPSSSGDTSTSNSTSTANLGDTSGN